VRIRVSADIVTEPRPGIMSMTVRELHTDGDGGPVWMERGSPPQSPAAIVREVVEYSASLSLDDEGDRELLIERLIEALEG
jgi:hypothetical protein